MLLVFQTSQYYFFQAVLGGMLFFSESVDSVLGVSFFSSSLLAVLAKEECFFRSCSSVLGGMLFNYSHFCFSRTSTLTAIKVSGCGHP